MCLIYLSCSRSEFTLAANTVSEMDQNFSHVLKAAFNNFETNFVADRVQTLRFLEIRTTQSEEAINRITY